MKTFKTYLILFSTLLGLSLALPAAAAGLAGSEWRPTEIAGKAIPDDSGAFVRFESDGRLAGHSGCNRFFGSYKLDGERIEIGPLGATKMACEPAVMEREILFMKALGGARSFQRDGRRLALRDENGDPLLFSVQTDWD
jgi:heat shock protein HslJ